MSLFAFSSAGGSPGVTTLTCLVAARWPVGRPVIVVECDPGGGVLAARFGLSMRIGLAASVAALRRALAAGGTADGMENPALPTGPAPIPTWITDNLQSLPGALPVLVGPPGADAATSVDRQLAAVIAQLSEAVDTAGIDVLVDCGRLLPGSPGQWAVLAASRRIVFLCGADVASVASARWAARRLAAIGGAEHLPAVPVAPSPTAPERAPARPRSAPPSLVTVAPTRVAPSEVAEVLAMDLLGHVPRDRTDPVPVFGPLRRWQGRRRSGAWPAAAAIARALGDDADRAATALPTDSDAGGRAGARNGVDVDATTARRTHSTHRETTTTATATATVSAGTT